MSIHVDCTTCGKAYVASEALAGKRMKCRQCGAVFAVPAPVSDDDPSERLAALAALERSQAGESMLSNTAINPAMSDDGAQELPESGVAPRRNVRMTYPYAVVVDRWLPVVLIVGGLAWITSTVMGANKSGSAGIAASRIIVMVLCYLLLLCPLAVKGLSMAGRDLNFSLPRARFWRSFAAFMPAFVIGAVLWTISGGIGALVVGIFVGLIVSVGPLWVLLRLKPNELPAAAGYAGGMMMFGLALAGGVLFGLNALLSSSLASMNKAHALPESPFGVAFAWPKPLEPAPVVASKKPLANASASKDPGTSPPGGLASAQPGEAPKVDVFENKSPEKLPDDAEQITFMGQDWTKDSPTSASLERTPPTAEIVSEAANTNAAPTPAPAPEAPITSPSPLVDGPVTIAAIDARFDQLIRPATPSNWAAVLRREGNNSSAERGVIERCWVGAAEAPADIAKAAGAAQIKPWTVVGAPAPYVRDPHVIERYALSPDGDLLAHVASFPSLSISVYSYNQKRVRTLTLDRPDANAEVWGFTSNDRVLVRRKLGDDDGFEIWDVKAGRVVKPCFRVPRIESASGSVCISPDGLMMGIAARDASQASNPAMLFLFDLSTNSQRKLMIPNLDVRWKVSPTGLSFSPDGTRIAVLFEEGGNGLLLTYRNRNSNRPLFNTPLQPMPVMVPSDFEGSSIAWLDDDALLLYGQKVMSLDGAEIGDLGIPAVRAAHTHKEDCQLTFTGANGARQIATAKIKLAAIPKTTLK